MGQCWIVSREGRSRYTIAVDLGEANRSARLLIANNRLAETQAAISAQTVKVAQADAREAALRAKAEAAILAYIQAVADLPPGAPAPSIKAYHDALLALSLERSQNQPLRAQLQALEIAKSQLLRHIAYLAGLTLTVTKPAWRPVWERAVSALPVGVVGWTIDIDNMPDLQLLGGAGSRAGDGLMTAMSVQGPEQAFWNLAVAPGWQKWKPLYRWGVVSSVNYEAETLDVALNASTSITQRLGINQTADLVNVPSEYQNDEGCNIYAFMPGDRVVVRFVDQDWIQPRVVGFLSDPVKGRIPYSFSTFVAALRSVDLSFQNVFAAGYVSRLNPQVNVSAPDIWKIGYYAIGWSPDFPDLGLQRQAVWTNDDELSVGGTYAYVSVLNGGFGELYGEVEAYAMMGPVQGSDRADNPIATLSTPTSSTYGIGGEVGEFSYTMVGGNLRYTWIMRDWGYNPPGPTPATFYTWTCPFPIDLAEACFSSTTHVAGTAEIVWESTVTGRQFGRSSVTVGRYNDGLGWRVIAQSALAIW